MLILPKKFAETLPESGDVWATLANLPGDIFGKGPGRRTIRVSRQGQSYFLKTHSGVGWKEVFKNFIQGKVPITSAKWEWEALVRLQELGVACPKAVGFGIWGTNPARKKSFILTEDIGPSITLEELWARWARNRPFTRGVLRMKWALIKEVARLIRLLHENGLNHQDLYLCHLRIHEENIRSEEEEPIGPVYLMDLHRAQIRTRTPTRWMVKDLGALLFSCLPYGITRGDQSRFIMEYAGMSLRRAKQTHPGFWERIERRAFRLYRKHGAPQLSSGIIPSPVEQSIH